MNKIKNKGLTSPTVILVLIIGLFASISLYNQISKNIGKSHTEEFKHLLKRQGDAVQRELDKNLQVLQSIESFYNSSNKVTRAEFKEFVKKPLTEYKSIQALEWIPRIKNKERLLYEQEANKDLGLDFNIKHKSPQGKMVVSGQKDEYFPVYYVEPLAGNEKALGFDLASSATRLKSLNEAKEKRISTATAKITLVQEKGKQSGFLVFVPIWNKNNDIELEGFALGVYRVGDMVNAALKFNQIDNSMIDVWLVDTTNKDKPDLLFTNTSNNQDFITEDFLDINIQGRTWTLYAKPSSILLNKNHSVLPLFVLIFGLLITSLISYILASNIFKAHELEVLVNDKTKTLRESNKRYESLLEMFDKKVIASRTDEKGIITYATTAFAQISGYSKEELIGKNHRILRHKDMSKELYVDLWKTITAGDTFTAEIKNKRKDGSFYWVRAVIMPEYNDDKQIIGYSAVRDDITAKKEVEELNNTLSDRIDNAVKENQKKDQLLIEQSKLAAMGEMIGAIAHQWRQPLNTLAIKVQFMEDDFEDDLIDQKYINDYSKESMKLISFMSKTIDDFRNFFTVDKIKSTFKVKEKIKDTTQMLEAQLENQNIKLEVEGDDFDILGYTSEFQQVILNIVNNAKDALVENKIENGKISIKVLQENNIGYVKISDNAGGIPQDVINRVFEPYFTTKEQGKGTGLGLYMSKMIMEDNMHGKLSVENKNGGAEFTISIEVINE